jgi:hypothetical protein
LAVSWQVAKQLKHFCEPVTPTEAVHGAEP